MGKLLKSVLHQQGGTVNYDLINKEVDAVELTPEETLAAIRAYKSKKLADQKQKAYAERVFKPIEYLVLDAVGLGKFMVAKIRTTMPEFVIDDQNRFIFKLMCLYYTNDPEFESLGYSLNKGIALIGPVGCGKTTLMRAFAINPTKPYIVSSCRKIADEYTITSAGKGGEQGGYTLIKSYAEPCHVEPRDHWGHTHGGRGFDDLGIETIATHYGNKKEVMEAILLDREDNILLKGQTHLTSNLSVEEIEERYGLRIRSRFRGMFNWITFDVTATDRRK